MEITKGLLLDGGVDSMSRGLLLVHVYEANLKGQVRACWTRLVNILGNFSSKGCRMSYEVGELSCFLVVETFSPAGLPVKKSTYRTAELALGRNEFRDVIIKVTNGQIDQKYVLRDIQIYKKFVKEGKATIKLMTQRIQLMMSNCPPDKLIVFLKALDTKLENQKAKGFVSERERLLSSQPRVFQEISPLQLKELQELHNKRAKVSDQANCYTVTPKRKREGAADKENVHCQATKKARQCIGGQGLKAVPKPGLQHATGNTQPIGSTQPIKSTQPMRSIAKLSKEQEQILQAVRDGHSLFFTGSAGTGKSYLLRRIIGALPPQHTFATASTGVAACHIGGTTLHSFAGIGSGRNPLEQCLELASRPVIAQQWRKCKHLIVDEISMVDGVFFDKLEAVARMIKKNDQPFGGIQLILCGDFLQLPPVTKGNEKRFFTFQAKSWRDCISKYYELTEVKRQSDMKFVRILQEIRMGRCSKAVSEVLLRTAKHSIEKDGILATRLCTHKEDVNHINFIHLNKLTGAKKVYMSTDSESSMQKQLDVLCPVPHSLELRLGAQVMLTKNLDVSRGLVNGARGVVVSYENDVQGAPVVRFMSGHEEVIRQDRWTIRLPGGLLVTRRQLPLKLAWAISIHKSQGMTLDCVEMSLSRVFESGQAYVALSRAKSLEGLRILDFSSNCVKADTTVLKFYNNINLTQTFKQKSIRDMLLEDSQ